jgi:dTDP-4-amino-4,6-dideoxygalactose transaminase
LPEYLQIKQRNFERYRRSIADIDGLGFAAPPDYARNNLWMYPLQIDSRRYRYDREGLMAYLAAQGIQTRPVWQLNHLQTPYRHCQSFRIERAPQLLANTLNIPCSVNLKSDDVDYVVEKLRYG